MKRFRFTIGSLLGVILVLGVGFAALRQSTDLWDSGLFTLTLAALAISILLAVHRTEKRRAFWLGFALFGWIYLGLSLVPSIESRLITSRALRYVDSKMPKSHTQGLAYFDFDNDGRMDLYVANNSQPSAVYRNRGNGTFANVTSAAGSNGGWFSNDFLVTTPTGSRGTTENFVRPATRSWLSWQRSPVGCFFSLLFRQGVASQIQHDSVHRDCRRRENHGVEAMYFQSKAAERFSLLLIGIGGSTGLCEITDQSHGNRS